jgi:heat shock protein HslJ
MNPAGRIQPLVVEMTHPHLAGRWPAPPEVPMKKLLQSRAPSRRPLSLALVVLLPLSLVACSKPPATDPAPGEMPAAADPAAPPPMDAGAAPAATDATALLPAHHWRLVEASDAQGQRIDALFVQADKPVQLDFADGRLAVSNTCNRMAGGFTLAGDQLTLGPMASTMMACHDPKLMALDAEVGKRLEGPSTLTATAGDTPRLVLVNAGGDRLVFDGTPTPATRFGGAPERVFLEVGPETKPCSHPLIPDKQCLQVREIRFDENGLRSGEPGEWQNFFDEIEGYTHQPGVRNVLRLDRYARKDVPADASRYAWVLDMVVESETVKP